MSHYLVRFFRHPKSAKQQRHLMLADGSWVLGEWIGPEFSIEAQMAKIASGDVSSSVFDDLSAARFYEDNFEDEGAAVSAFNRLAVDATKSGYVLVDLIDRMVDVIAPDAPEKPDWQDALDRYLLDVLARKPNARSPKHEAARNEPLQIYLDALRLHRTEPDRAADALTLALSARDELDRRKVSSATMYLWSIDRNEFEARINQLLMQIHQKLGNSDAMFAAIRRACDLSIDPYRSECLAVMQCYHFPQYREDAFETAFRYGDDGYAQVKEHEDFAAYAKQRRKEVKSGKPILRWHAMQDPSSDAEIAAAEVALGATLPADYKAFLAERGRCKLSFMLGDEHKDLSFAGATDIAIWKGVFDHWLETMGAARENLTAEWPAKYGVDARTLYSIATPWDNSSCFVMDLAPGKGHGRCFFWDHDEAYDLIAIGADFTQALDALQIGFTSGDADIRLFFDFLPPEAD
jgi:SMI1 / KNR4 family (SUKH-1)